MRAKTEVEVKHAKGPLRFSGCNTKRKEKNKIGLKRRRGRRDLGPTLLMRKQKRNGNMLQQKHERRLPIPKRDQMKLIFQDEGVRVDAIIKEIGR